MENNQNNTPPLKKIARIFFYIYVVVLAVDVLLYFFDAVTDYRFMVPGGRSTSGFTFPQDLWIIVLLILGAVVLWFAAFRFQNLKYLNKRLSDSRFYLIIVIVVAVVLGGGYMVVKQQGKKAEVINETVNWKTYTNTQYGFEFKYPQNYNNDSEEPDIFISVDKEPYTLGFHGTWGSVPYSEAGSANLIYSENVVINNIIFKKDYWLLRAAADKDWFADVSFNTKYNNKYYTIYGGVVINISGISEETAMGYSGNQVTDKNIIDTALNDIRNTEKNIMLDKILSTFKFTK